MNKEDKIEKIKLLARNFGLNNDEHLIEAFDVTKIYNRATNSKGAYANSALATLGDAVIKLHIVNTAFKCNLDSGGISRIRSECEKNDKLAWVCKIKDYPQLLYCEKKQSTDSIYDDPASLLEAIVGAIFIDKGFSETSKILDAEIPI